MNFHLGKPILVMIVIALLAGAMALTEPAQKKTDLTLWVFADSHVKSYREPVKRFQERTGISVTVNLVAALAEDLRLSSLFMTDPYSPELPDLAEIEIGWVGKYFRPPIEDIGFIPLNDFLKESGWGDKLVKQRLAPWTKNDVIFGIPHDVHPVTITYRDDLFAEAGIDLAAADAWPKFQQACQDFEKYWRKRSHPHRHALEAGVSDTSLVQVILLQRGINIVDQYNTVRINDPRVAQTISFYAQLVAGPRRIGGQSSGGEGALIKDINEGNLCAFLTADWRVGYIKRYAPALAGKMRMMPLPRFEPTDRPTSTWGGTMVGITKSCRRPRDAWKLIEYLYFSEECLEERRKETGILPPVMSIWDQPMYRQPDPFFGGQSSQGLFVDLGRQVPERFQTPASPIAATALSFVLNKAVAYVKEHNGGAGLEAQVQAWLDDAARDLNRRIVHWRFE